MSFITGFSPRPLGTIFRRRRSSTNNRFEQVRRSREPIGDGQTEVGDARLEIVVKAGERARRDHGVVGADAARQLARDRSRQRLVAGGDARLELRPQIGRDLDGEVAHAMGQAALARRARKAFLDRPNDSRRAVGDDEQGIAQASCAQVLEEGPNRLNVLLRTGHRRHQDLAPIGADAPGGERRLPFLPRTEAFGVPST